MSKTAAAFLLGLTVGSLATVLIGQIRIVAYDEEMDDLVARLGREIDELERRAAPPAKRRTTKR